jgi:ribosomal protein L19
MEYDNMREVLIYFHVSGVFIGKKHDLSEKKIRLSRAVVGVGVDRKFMSRQQPSPLKLES